MWACGVGASTRPVVVPVPVPVPLPVPVPVPLPLPVPVPVPARCRALPRVHVCAVPARWAGRRTGCLLRYICSVYRLELRLYVVLTPV